MDDKDIIIADQGKAIVEFRLKHSGLKLTQEAIDFAIGCAVEAIHSGNQNIWLDEYSRRKNAEQQLRDTRQLHGNRTAPASPAQPKVPHG